MIALVLAATMLTPMQVLDEARAAYGQLAHGAYRIEERETAFGGTITFERVQDGANYQETVHNGDFTTAAGYLDGTAWRQNPNGIVVLRNRRPITSDPYLLALSTPDSGNQLRVLDTNGEIVLEITPRKGLVQRRYYDPKTFLLQRVEYDDTRGEESYVFSDYRSFYGQTMPMRVQFNNQFPEDAWTSDVISFEQIPEDSVHLAIPQNRPVFDVGDHASLPIPTQFTAAGIVVRVTVAGRGLDFLLDSGASASVIDANVARELGLTVVQQRSFEFMGTVKDGLTMISDLAVGDIHARHFAIDAIPFSLKDGDHQIVGLLGADFFASARVAIDFGAQTVTMLSPAAALPSTGWTKLPIEVTNLVPYTHASFNGVRGTFVVDTGATDTLLFPHYFANFKADKPGEVIGRMEGISGELHDYRKYQFSRLDLGDLAFTDVSADVMSGQNTELMIGADGLLGRNIWNNFSMIFDYADESIYIKPEL